MAFIPDAPSKFVPDAPPPTQAAAPEPEEHGPVQDVIDMVKSGVMHVPQALVGLVNGLTGGTDIRDPAVTVPQNLRNLIHTIANPTETLSSIGTTLRNATPQQVGANVLAPMIAGGGVGKVAGLAGGAAATPTEALGLNAGGGGILRNVAAGAAGEEGRAALSTQNVNAATRVAGNQVGIPANVPVTPTSLDAAKAQPGAVLDAAAAQVPTGPVHPAAVQDIQNAAANAGRITKGSPNATAQINDMVSHLTDPNGQYTGAQIRAEGNGLRADGNKGIDSSDPDIRTVAQFQREAAAALDKHVELTLPQNATVSPDQVQLARKTLAQNYTVGDLMKGPYMDLPGLGKLHANNPNLLTGDLRTLGQFSVDHPEVSGLPTNPDRFAPPGFATGVGRALGAEGGDVGSRLSSLFGVPTIAKKVLGSNPEASMAAASSRPVTGLAGEFDEQPMKGLAPPAGQVGNAPIQRSMPLQPGSGQVSNPMGGLTASPSPAQNSPAAAGPPGQIPLADLLAHGVEQSPPQGLSLGSTPNVPTGVPFRPNLEHASGGLTLDDLLNGPPRTYGGQPASDVPGVMSANVPDNVMSRTGRANNASSPTNSVSLEGEAAKNQAVAEGKQQISFGADDQQHVMGPHDIDRRDLNPAPDSVFIDPKTQKVVNSGTQSPRAAAALLARWKAIHGTPLGSAYD